MDPRRAIRRQALLIALATAPFGVAFGVAARDAGLGVATALGYSALVFTGSAQFAAVSVLADGGTVAAAVTAGALLNLRSFAFGLAFAPALRGAWWWRAVAAQLVIDEAAAIGSAQSEPGWRRYGFLAGGASVFVLWNLATMVGFVALSGSEGFVAAAGIDATIPAAFLALAWPRLRRPEQRASAIAGACIAFLLAPVAPAGVPVIAASCGVVLARPWRVS